VTDKRKSETSRDLHHAVTTGRIVGFGFDVVYILRRFWRNPVEVIKRILYCLDMRFEISDLAKAAGNGERLVIRDWIGARESGDFVALAHIQRYEWVSPRVTELECLDAGCGSGYGAYHLAMNGANSVVGVDISSVAIRFAKNRFNTENVQFGIMDVRNLAVKEDSFDVVISFDVMEHLERGDQDRFVSEVARVLRPKGRVYLGCPNISASSGTNPFHLGELTRDEFETLMEKHFRDVVILGQDLIHEGRRQFGSLSIVGRVKELNISNFLIVEERPEASYGLLAVCENPMKALH